MKRICPICGFLSRGHGYKPPRDKSAAHTWFCSIEHREAYAMGLKPEEEAALKAAAIAAGNRLHERGNMDLAALSEAEYLAYVRDLLETFRAEVVKTGAEYPF